MFITSDPTEFKDFDFMAQNLSSLWPSIQGKNLLITGGAGMLGHYFALFPLFMNQYYEGKKTHVYLLDKSFPPHHWAVLLKKNNPHLTLIESNMMDGLEQFNLPNINWIIHAASLASPISYRRHPLNTIHANVHAWENLLEFLRKKNNVEGILYLSSSEIYGDPPKEMIPTPETYNGNVAPLGPRACYDESKRLGETLAWIYHEHHQLPIKITRPFNHYGPGLLPNDGRVLADFVKNILLNKDITIYSDGTPTRTFCYVADAIIGHYKALLSGPVATPINIGTQDDQISIKDLASKIQLIALKQLNYRGRVCFENPQEKYFLTHNPIHRCPDTSLAKELLNFSAQINLETGLSRYLTWCHDRHKRSGQN